MTWPAYSERREYFRRLNQERRAECIREGWCVWCWKMRAAEGRQRCEACLARARKPVDAA